MHDDEHTLCQDLKERIIRWVTLESPSHDAQALQRMAELIEKEARALGLQVDKIALDEKTGPALHIHNRRADNEQKGILVLGHYDTVHPIGTLKKNPCRQEQDKLYGPGIYDMKAGICLVFEALGQVIAQKQNTLPIDILLLPDEETGSHYSRALIEQFARQAKYCLVAEPARADGGRCVTARKGTGSIHLTTRGRASHAGVAHEKGVNAIEEMAHQILALQALTDYRSGTTINVGTIQGGTTSNVVPDHCHIEADFRIVDEQAGTELEQAVGQLQPVLPGAQLEVVFDLNRPAMPRTPDTVALLEQCQAFARQAGFELQEAPRTGGASDANFTAALGVPTLDGLGADGDGAHTLEEYILVSTLAQRAMFWYYTLIGLQ